MEENYQELLEPLKLYKYELKYKHDDIVEEFFNNLANESGVDVEANRATCREYYKNMDALKNQQKQLDGQKGLRGLLIFLTILFFVAGTVLVILPFFNVAPSYTALFISLGVVSILLGILFIILNSVIISKRISEISKKMAKLQEIANKLKEQANQQMLQLNGLYDWSIPAQLVSKTIPLLKLDRYYDVEKYKYFVGNFKLAPLTKDNVSAIVCQSGSILGNPILWERDYIQYMYQKTYTGSITISWTTYEYDEKGRSRPVHHTQTLTASVSKPASGYRTETSLIYGNEAAPKLSFSRSPSSANSMSNKDLEKFTAKTEKELAKMQQSKIKSNFTPLGNAKFEGLFHAYNRDNEVEFRLLFTPLAQKSMIDLITSKTPYGDDFTFIKRKMINIIQSSHMQYQSFDGNPYHYYNFDFDKAKDAFIAYNQNYFQALFYDLAPLLSIPLYQQHKDFVKEYYEDYKGNITLTEAEILANYFPEDTFKPEDCDTHVILKANFVSNIKNGAIYTITAYGFRKEPRVDYATRVGGDGLTHTIPIPWEEYIETEKTSMIAVMDVGGSKHGYYSLRDQLSQLVANCSSKDDIIFQRGLIAFILNEGVNSFNPEAIIKLFSQKED